MNTQQPTNTVSNIARRSLSIFSRRGYDAPSCMVQSLDVGTLALAEASTPTPPTPPTPPTQLPMHSKSKQWRLRRQSEPKTPQGTIIRLVPKESAAPSMTPLEIEMATAPNEEILRKIGLSPDQPSPSPVEAIYFPVTPSPSVASRRMSRRERKSFQGKVVGLWKDGNISWASNRSSVLDPATEMPERPKTSDGLPKSRSETPKLQVVIPQSSQRMFASVPWISNSALELHFKENGSHDVSPPSVATNHSVESFQISALEHDVAFRLDGFARVRISSLPGHACQFKKNLCVELWELALPM